MENLYSRLYMGYQTVVTYRYTSYLLNFAHQTPKIIAKREGLRYLFGHCL